ncbi:MAG TPA: polyprenyl synthetase family protein [Polyangiaceae bacterium]|jgi:geranylgeranyl pyrophosphate synthase
MLVPWWEDTRRRYDGLVVERLGLRGRLGEVATYALAGGKRIRPLLAEAIGEALAAPSDAVTRVAIAVEYLHTASLLLDDLPAMDRARERRGVEPAHLRFSEADAILAAVTLVARSYAIMLGDREDDMGMRHSMAQRVSSTIVGMAGGQSLELAIDTEARRDDVESIHQRKTAALFALVARLISTATGADDSTMTSFVRFAEAFGAAYQIWDDLQDRGVEGEQRGNLACLVGADPARQMARAHLRGARDALGQLGTPSTLLSLCVEWLSESLEAVA